MIKLWWVPVGAVVFFVCIAANLQEKAPCTARNEVRYIGDQRQVCVQTTLDGLRWDPR